MVLVEGEEAARGSPEACLGSASTGGEERAVAAMALRAEVVVRSVGMLHWKGTPAAGVAGDQVGMEMEALVGLGEVVGLG